MDFDFKITDDASYQIFLNYLKSVSKNETIEDKKRHIAILNTKQDVIAIAMSTIRKIAKKIFKNGYDEFFNFSLKNDYKKEFYEETLIQGLVIAEIKDLNLQAKLFNTWVQKIDNWSTCDTVVSTMKGLKNSKLKNDYFAHYSSLCYSKDEFVSRFGIIVLMTCFLEEEYVDDILKMCEKVKHDGYYVKMAVAWLLSYAFVKFKQKTYDFLGQKVLDKFTQNKAISKCRESFRVEKQDKENLLNYKIK